MSISKALEAGDFAQARDLIAEMEVFENIRADDQGGANVSGVKMALRLMGEDVGIARPPAVWPLSERQLNDLRDFLSQNGLLRT